MDPSEYKYSNWVLTVSPTKDHELVSIESLTKTLRQASTQWVFQEETASRRHYQCCFKTSYRMRHRTLLKLMSDLLECDDTLLTLQSMSGTWSSAVAYCTKDDTRTAGPFYSDDNLIEYDGSDVNFLKDLYKRLPWQRSLLNILLEEGEEKFTTPDDRTIIWVNDPIGKSGKSKLVKYLFMNYSNVTEISFGSSNQLRTALIALGRKTCYFIDIPRTIGPEDSLATMLSVIEKLKGGFLTSTMYGKFTSLVMPPPHIVIFANRAPDSAWLSKDRWNIYEIDKDKLLKDVTKCY